MANESVTVTQSLDQVTVVSDGPIGLNAGGTILGALNVGVDGTGHDVKFFGDTAGKYMQWDQSADKLFVNGEIEVNGTATTFNSTVITIDDPIFTLGGQQRTDALDDSKDRGIEFFYHDGAQKTGFMGYDDSADAFTFLTSATNSNEVFSGTAGNLLTGNITVDGNISGTASQNNQGIEFSASALTLRNGAGSGGETITLGSNGAVVNATSSSSFDFTVKSATSASALHVESSDGNVGIGTASPAHLLHVYSSGNGEIEVERASGAAILTQAQASLGRFGTSSNHNLQLMANNSGYVTVTTAGNVGLGTSAPTRELHLDSGDALTTFKISNSTSGATITDGFDIELSSTTARLNNREGNIELAVSNSNVATLSSDGLSLGDNLFFRCGDSADLTLSHDASNSYIANETGDLYIRNSANDKDIIFQSDDGSGGVETYFFLDGSASSGNPFTVFPDNSLLAFGSGRDFILNHNGSNTNLGNYTGDIEIVNYANDKDIIFKTDDGSGGTAEYFRLDGSAAGSGNLFTIFPDSSYIGLGSNGTGDFIMAHNGTNTTFSNYTGNLQFTNNSDDGDIIFRCDDGSGGVETYFFLDGSANGGANPYTVFPDNSILAIGDGKDLIIWHNATNSYVQNSVGDLHIENYADDKDILFRSDNGSGGLETYFFLDGSTGYTQFPDNKRLALGSSDDFQIYHDALDSKIENSTGHIYVTNFTDDKDIIFQTDDGSGGVTPYITLDGSTEQVAFSKALNYSTTLVNDSNYTTTRSDSVILFHSMSTYRYLTLASADCVAGRKIHVKNRDNSEYIYIQTEGSENIDGSSMIIGTQTARGSITLISDGSNWFILNKYST